MLDRELAEAVARSESEAQRVALEVRSAPQPRPLKHRPAWLAVALVLGGVILLGSLAAWWFEPERSVSIEKLTSDPQRYAGRELWVSGRLVHGSLAPSGKCGYRFVLASNNALLPVRYPHCVVPDAFQDEPGLDNIVTVQGVLGSEGHFQASAVMTRSRGPYRTPETHVGPAVP